MKLKFRSKQIDFELEINFGLLFSVYKLISYLFIS